MPERRYSDEEVAAILKGAADAEHAALPVASESGGMTLSTLQEIGREVGMSPESIAQAARSMDVAGKPVSRSFVGFPVAVGRTVVLDRPLSDAQWELLVADLRETFDARGRVQVDGSFRQWVNGNLQALVEPTPTGFRLRLKTMNANVRTLMAFGAGAFGLATAATVARIIGGTIGRPGAMESTIVLAIIGAGLFAFGAVRLPAWARTRRAQMDEVIGRLTG
jgi:hypothetical protein